MEKRSGPAVPVPLLSTHFACSPCPIALYTFCLQSLSHYSLHILPAVPVPLLSTHFACSPCPISLYTFCLQSVSHCSLHILPAVPVPLLSTHFACSPCSIAVYTFCPEMSACRYMLRVCQSTEVELDWLG